MSHSKPSYKFAYYCSGHGYGHATRVTAISHVLLSQNHTVHVISSAPKSVFTPIINFPSGRGSYRYAVLEPTVVQPKAYDVDRKATFLNLQSFLAKDRSRILEEESKWLVDSGIQCVLIDASFLPCAAARKADIPSVIISNFTFDSCYSYLSSSSVDHSDNSEDGDESPIDSEALEPLVKVTISDYSQAELLLRLPGAIPIPGFDTEVQLPATRWVDQFTNSFIPEIHALLDRPAQKSVRKVIDMPLVVRPTSRGIYEPEKKLKLLRALKVPKNLENLETKILLVSFGGQLIPRPKTSYGENCQGQSLLPDGWIAIVCGLSVDYLTPGTYDRFYVSKEPEWDYVPDLSAIADVILGKLGYGTCSESLATMTPFVHVPRPDFVEEYGLKRLMRGVTNLEMSRKDFEDGNWSEYIKWADSLGSRIKREFILKRKENISKSNEKIGKMNCEIYSSETGEDDCGKKCKIGLRKEGIKKIKGLRVDEKEDEDEGNDDQASKVVVNHLEKFLFNRFSLKN
ncbi:hypothetical protein PPACK8108_LOCUS24188 [Phakopsora pachyrhizi]|uniref:L-arabinokinase n=1 Tax=Phakopsora pachyrhizi TaxID=170000 RepID=A0AAV0BSD9_PHAPC|nr:hypothetical protein PPACK8108_LOCUS24188 [Phakopsora pachyrhizi]